VLPPDAVIDALYGLPAVPLERDFVVIVSVLGGPEPPLDLVTAPQPASSNADPNIRYLQGIRISALAPFFLPAGVLVGCRLHRLCRLNLQSAWLEA
jgi:hypothetical protein